MLRGHREESSMRVLVQESRTPLEHVGALELDLTRSLGKHSVCVHWLVGYGIYCGDLRRAGCQDLNKFMLVRIVPVRYRETRRDLIGEIPSAQCTTL